VERLEKSLPFVRLNAKSKTNLQTKKKPSVGWIKKIFLIGKITFASVVKTNPNNQIKSKK